MSDAPLQPRCELSFAVIARHLDGDVDDLAPVAGSGWQPADFLTEHLRECPHCQRALQQSRRLDAALAEASGRATVDLDADGGALHRLLDRAVVAGALAEAAAARAALARAGRLPPRPHQVAATADRGVALSAAATQPAARVFAAARWLWRVAAAAALLLLGYRAVTTVVPTAVTDAPTPAGIAPPPVLPPAAPPPSAELPLASADAPAPAPTATASWHGIPLLAPARRRPQLEPIAAPPRSRGEAIELGTVLADRHLDQRLWLTARLHGRALGAPPARRPARVAAEGIQRRCAEALLDAPAGLGRPVWTHATASLEAGPLLDRVLDDGRRSSGLLGFLRSRLQTIGGGSGPDLDDLAALTAAVRLGGRDLDAAVRQTLRRVDLHQELAAAMRSLPQRPGRVELLLDVWGDLVARGAADDEGLARDLFGGQPRAAVADLGRELQQSRHTPRRLRCLLALGAVGTDDVLELLLPVLQSRALPEAMAGAYALAQLPAAALLPLRPNGAREPRAWLLRAALCCRGLADGAPWLANPDITPAERQLLLRGGWTFAQFPVLANLLRDRTTASH